MITADRIRIVSPGTPRGNRELEVKRVTRLRASQRAKSEQSRVNRDRRIKALMEEIAAELVKAPAESATELGRRLIGAATSTEQAMISEAVRGLVAANRVVRGPDRRYRLLSKGEVQ